MNWDVSSWPKACDLCGQLLRMGDLIVKPWYLDNQELTYINVCRPCWHRTGARLAEEGDVAEVGPAT